MRCLLGAPANVSLIGTESLFVEEHVRLLGKYFFNVRDKLRSARIVTEEPVRINVANISSIMTKVQRTGMH